MLRTCEDTMPQRPLFPEKSGLQVATCEFDEMNLQIGERIVGAN